MTGYTLQLEIVMPHRGAHQSIYLHVMILNGRFYAYLLVIHGPVLQNVPFLSECLTPGSQPPAFLTTSLPLA